MEWSAASDVGRVRQRNEDAYDVIELPAPVGGRLFIVADGVGGNRAGDVASNLAVRQLRTVFLDWVRSQSGAVSGDVVVAALARSVQRVNDAVVRCAARRPEWHGMGTTLTAVRVCGPAYQYAHVGDSRLYRLHADQLAQISRDHALVSELMRSGQLDERQARDHPARHVLTQAVGMDRQLEIDAGQGVLADGDRLLLCTDGLTAVLEDADLLAILRDAPAGGLAERLVKLANQRGAPDNVTVIIVSYRATPGAAADRQEEAGR
ncbi:MAG TPA: Stp1/IreP family PP2C-type Ser/Thr phosphatase [Bacillota bacterium]